LHARRQRDGITDAGKENASLELILEQEKVILFLLSSVVKCNSLCSTCCGLPTILFALPLLPIVFSIVLFSSCTQLLNIIDMVFII